MIQILNSQTDEDDNDEGFLLGRNVQKKIQDVWRNIVSMSGSHIPLRSRNLGIHFCKVRACICDHHRKCRCYVVPGLGWKAVQ